MNRLSLLAMASLVTVASYGQKIPLIHSGELIEIGKAQYDSGHYDKAIAIYKAIPKRDTNHIYAIDELAITYLAAKKYDSAILLCKEGLSKPSDYRVRFLRANASALDSKGEFDQAVAALQKTCEEYPFDVSSIYNLGVTYLNHKDYDKAEECFFKAITINPFHPGSHLQLGRIAMGKGRKTHAIFSTCTYLALRNNANEWLVNLNSLLSNQYKDEGSIPASGSNGCEKLDQILKARIAMDENFKTTIPVDAPVVKQTEMFFSQLATISTSTDDRWVAFYLPIYKALKEKNIAESFMYYMMASANIESIKKWNQKNEKELKNFFAITNAEMSKIRDILTTPERFGYKKPVHAWYSNNLIDALGEKQPDGKRDGQWYFFYNNHQLSAEGKFASEKKIGTWKYHRSDGTLKSIENYDTGEVTVFDQDGNKTQHFYLKDGAIDGVVELFHPCGGLSEKLNYKLGKRHGPGETFYTNGVKASSYVFSENNLEGTYLTYYDDGQLYSKTEFKNDLRHGSYKEYYANGKIQSTGEYVNGKLDGEWKFYYINGKLIRTGKYVAGAAVGDWLYYDEHGTAVEKRPFDNEGKMHGENIVYHDGKMYYTVIFKTDVITKISWFDINGKEIFTAGNDKGSFESKSFYPGGQLSGEGAYKNGLRQGHWTYYYPEGTRQSEFNYEKGNITGKAIEYFQNGAKKSESEYKDDALDGYYISWFQNGTIASQGWYQNGQRQQQWLFYLANGAIEMDYYYRDDEQSGENYNYSARGNLFSVSTYSNNKLDDIRLLSTAGENTLTTRIDGNKKIYESKYPGGKNRYEFTTRCGQSSGKFNMWFPDGNIFTTYQTLNGKNHGEYIYNGIENEVETKGSFVNGSREGDWVYYRNGKLDSRGRYLNDKLDSTWQYFFSDGKVSQTIEMRDGDRNGLTVIYSPDGNAILEKMYDDDNLISYRTVGKDGKFGNWIIFKGEASIAISYTNGNKAYEEAYKNGVFEGPRRTYYSDGSLYQEHYYRFGDFEGTYKKFYPNGKLSEKRQYKDDELTGVVECYNQDGTLYKTEEYICGVREGKSTLYKNGVKVKEITFVNNQPQN